MSSYKKVRHNYTCEPKLCDFDRVELKVPRVKLLKLLSKKTHLCFEETVFLRFLVSRTEVANHRILHVQSIAEKALLKSGSRGA